MSSRVGVCLCSFRRRAPLCIASLYWIFIVEYNLREAQVKPPPFKAIASHCSSRSRSLNVLKTVPRKYLSEYQWLSWEPIHCLLTPEVTFHCGVVPEERVYITRDLWQIYRAKLHSAVDISFYSTDKWLLIRCALIATRDNVPDTLWTEYSCTRERSCVSSSLSLGPSEYVTRSSYFYTVVTSEHWTLSSIAIVRRQWM